MIRVHDSKNFTIGGGSEPCPRCGGRAEYQGGTYDFVGDVMTAFRAPGMTRMKAEAVRDIAERVKAGDLTWEQAKAATAEHAPALVKIWDWLGENDKQLQILLIIIGLFVAHYHFTQTSAGSESDFEIRQQNAQVLEKIATEIEKLNTSPKASPPTRAVELLQKSYQEPTVEPKNRRERRKAQSIQKRERRRQSD